MSDKQASLLGFAYPTTRKGKMPKASQTNAKISELMAQALLALRDLVDHDQEFEMDYSQVVTTFLQGVISTAIDLAELHSPGVSPIIYADIEALSKLGGLRAIKKMQDEKGSISYSVSNIDPNDVGLAMNYLGKEMATTLFKGIHELPIPLRNEEMLLRAVESLLANLLREKFNNSHAILDSFCEHVHMAMKDVAPHLRLV